MSLKTKIACAVMSAAMIFTMAGCGQNENTKTIGTYKGEEIPVGIYLYGMVNSIEDAKAEYIGKQEETVDINKIDIVSAEIEDGVKGEQWILDKSKEYLYNYLAVKEMYSELGYELPTTINENIAELIESQKGQAPEFFEYLNKIGVSEESYKKNLELGYMLNDMFPKYYAENGVSPVSEDEYKAQYELQYRRAFILPISFVDNNGVPYTEAKQKEIEDLANLYLEKLNNGESLESVSNSYYNYVTGQDKEDVEAAIPSQLIDIDNVNLPSDFIKNLDESDDSKYIMAKDEFSIIIGKKDDMYSNMDDFENMKPAMLKKLKSDEFNSIIDEKAAALASDVKFNEASLNRYNVKDFAKRAK